MGYRKLHTIETYKRVNNALNLEMRLSHVHQKATESFERMQMIVLTRNTEALIALLPESIS